MENNVLKLHMCSCHGEGLIVEKWEPDEIYLAMFSCGTKYDGSPMSLKDRIRYCWNVLTTGKPFLDEIVLSNDTAKKLGQELIRMTECCEGGCECHDQKSQS